MIQKMKKSKGFTLIEMLVVIAIIAVLVAIIIPTVSGSTEKAHEAKDAANIRSAIAEVTTQALTGTTTHTETVTLTQSDSFTSITDIGGIPSSVFEGQTSVTVAWDNNAIVIKSGTTVLYPTASQQ